MGFSVQVLAPGFRIGWVSGARAYVSTYNALCFVSSQWGVGSETQTQSTPAVNRCPKPNPHPPFQKPYPHPLQPGSKPNSYQPDPHTSPIARTPVGFERDPFCALLELVSDPASRACHPAHTCGLDPAFVRVFLVNDAAFTGVWGGRGSL